MGVLHLSTGILRYSLGDYGYKLIVQADQEIMRYYRSLIPKWISTNRPMYDAHISVVRKETPSNLEHWSKHDGEEVEFLYSSAIHHGEVYWWLNCWCNRLEDIRLELGLPVDSPYTRPPDGLQRTFHLTIGNTK